MMVDQFHYSIHNFVTISSDIELPLPSNLVVHQLINPTIRVVLGEINYSRRERVQFGSKYYWDAEIASLVVDWGLGVKAEIRDVPGQTLVRFNQSFRRFGDPYQLVKSLIRYHLLREGATFIHAAGLRLDSGKGIMLQGWSNMGKSSTTMVLMERHRCGFVGDDSIIVQEQNMYSFTRNIGLSPGTLIPQGTLTPRERLERKIRALNDTVLIGHVMPVLPNSRMEVTPERLFGTEQIVGHDQKIPVDACVFLQPPDAGPDWCELPSIEARRRATINSYFVGEASEADHHLLQAYYYLDNRIDAETVTNTHNELVRRFFSSCRCFEVRTVKSRYGEVIEEKLDFHK